MSGATYGYVDASSTDKGAADEPDEVELQMLRLTGEGVKLSISHSMLGFGLRRLVSEKLPRKPGAKLVVHHVNRRLKLDQNLLEQVSLPSSLRSLSFDCSFNQSLERVTLTKA